MQAVWRAMNLISIQSHVAYGHVGNSAAVFALQRLGCEVWPIHTVQFSNHTGYDSWKGEIFAPELIDALVDGLAERGALGACGGVLSGYIGSVAIGDAILRAVGRVRTANAKTSYCCDPVIGNRHRGRFVGTGIAEFFRMRAVPAADIITPNHFEFECLVGHACGSHAEIVAAAAGLPGPRAVLVTSVNSCETPSGTIDTIACDAAGAHLVRTPKLETPANGAGDLIAALFLVHYLRLGSAAAALGRATSSVFGVLRATGTAPEMLLIDGQEELVAPSVEFTPVAVSHCPQARARSGARP
jgi:pyridoxine kinase